ncbi:MAG: amino acid adenylation domain-containing protein [Acidobacteriota bacterium]|nr:amino acid adenylation domain-containing protein [Acidobacteriota bacterium]
MDIKSRQYLPLSGIQETLFFETINLNPKIHQGQISFKIECNWTASRLLYSWQKIINLNVLLRTSFSQYAEKHQFIHGQIKVSDAFQDLSTLDPRELDQKIRKLLREDLEQPFDLSEAPLARFSLWKLGENRYYCVWAFHGIVLDRDSMRFIIHDFLVQASGRETPNRPVFFDYLSSIKNQETDSQSFWRRQLAGYSAPTLLLSLPPNNPDEADILPQTITRRMITAALVGKLQDYAKKHDLDFATLVKGAWVLLVSRYSNEETVIVGHGVTARCQKLPTEQMIGPLSNVLPLLVKVEPGISVLEYLADLDNKLEEQAAYADNALGQIKEWMGMSPLEPFFQCLVKIDHSPCHHIQHDACRISEEYHVTGLRDMVHLEMSLGQQPSLRLFHRAGSLYEGTPELILEQLHILLEALVERRDEILVHLPLLSVDDKQRLLVTWNGDPIDYPEDQTITRLFDAQVARTPDVVAVSYESEQLTFGELDHRGNQLAHHLQNLGVGPEVRVAVCIERSVDMIVAIIGILKAGSAFVPIDPDYPYQRLSFMLEDARTAVVITQNRLQGRLPKSWGFVLCMDSDWEMIAHNKTEKPVNRVRAANLAYVMYTSGSTGKPKGVMVPHRGVCNSSEVYARVIDMPPGSRMLQITSLGFDMSVFDIVPALFSGLTLCLANQTPPLGEDLLDVFRKQRIEIVSFPPSILATVPFEDLPDLRFIGVAGEAVSSELVALWSPGRRFYNAYGPAEGSVWCSGSFVEGSQRPHIGRSIANARIYLVDPHCRPVPIGVLGELLIGGFQVTRGYLGRPEVTAQAYIPDPFSGESGSRVYKTGDLARYLPDGNIEFVGRVDHQIKIRGIRIELGEIEAVLGNHPDIRENVVLAREDTPGEKRLCAYIVCQDNHVLNTTEIYTYLREKLPENMIPSTFILMRELPLTPNGKLDRKALPAPDSSRPNLADKYIAPSSPLEKVMAQIWREILGYDEIGVHDNFFELGGHSLFATQAISRINETLLVNLLIVNLFDMPTIAELATVVKDNDPEPQRVEKTAELLIKLAEMGEDEVDNMLESMPPRTG